MMPGSWWQQKECKEVAWGMRGGIVQVHSTCGVALLGAAAPWDVRCAVPHVAHGTFWRSGKGSVALLRPLRA